MGISRSKVPAGICLVIAWVGFGWPSLALAQTEPAGPPTNCFTEAPPAQGPQFVPDPLPPALEYYPRWEFNSEAVFFLFRSPNVRFPLATLGNVNDPTPGALGQPGTVVLVDGSNFRESFRLAGKITGTYWMTQTAEELGIQASGFIMEGAPLSYNLLSKGNATDPLLARPFFNALTGAEDASQRSNPGILTGNINQNFLSRMYGADASIIYNLTGYAQYGPSFFVLAGPRLLRFDENYFSNETSTVLPVGTGTSTLTQDYFSNTNTFYGVQAGTLFRYRLDGITFDMITKIAIGNNYETLKINGQTTVTDQTTGIITSANQGFFAQPSNIGQYSQNVFAVIPELNLKLHVDLTPNIKVTLGYGFLYMNRMARPADQLDRNINIQPVGGPIAAPLAPVRPTSIAESNFWTNFLSIGMELVF